MAALDQHWERTESDGTLGARRRARLAERTRAVVDRTVQRWLWSDGPATHLLQERLDRAANGETSPYDIAAEVVAAVKEGARV